VNKVRIQRQYRQRRKRQGLCWQNGCFNKADNLCMAHQNSRDKYAKLWSAQLKIETLSHYGKRGRPQCCWRNCNIVDIDMLSLDHVENDGAKARKGRNKGGVCWYSELRKNKFPKGFQTLCFNHQMKKEILKRRNENDN